MSKKKNTLKDLDEFLKQQAASLVSPEKLNVKTEPKKVEPEPEPEAELQHEITPESQPVLPQPAPQEFQQPEPSFRNVYEQLKALSKKTDSQVYREKLFDLLLATVEAQPHQTPEDKVLINTLLYLKHGQHWKEGIREYWQNHE